MYSQWRRRWRGSVEYAQSLGCGSRWPVPGGGDWWRRTLRRLPRSPCLFLPLDPYPAACHPLALSSTPPGRSPPRPSRWPVVLGRLLFQQVSTEKRKSLLILCFLCLRTGQLHKYNLFGERIRDISSLWRVSHIGSAQFQCAFISSSSSIAYTYKYT